MSWERSSYWWLVGVILAVATIAGSCVYVQHLIDQVSGPSRAEQLQELARRPDIDRVTQRYLEMQAELRDRLAAEFGITWHHETPQRDDQGSGCRNFVEVDDEYRQSRELPGLVSTVTVPDAQWPAAVDIVREVSGNYGFDSPRIAQERAGAHEIVARDGFGARVALRTEEQSRLSVATGCHLTADARQLPRETTATR